MVDQPTDSPDNGPDAAEPFRLAPNAAPGKLISAEAKRALQEADARRKAAQDADIDTSLPPENAGPKGAEPTRFGDWERGGIAYDF